MEKKPMASQNPHERQITREQAKVIWPHLRPFWDGSIPVSEHSKVDAEKVSLESLVSVAAAVFTIIGHPKQNYRTAFTGIKHLSTNSSPIADPVTVDINLFNTLSDFFQDAADILTVHRDAYRHKKKPEEKEHQLLEFLNATAIAPDFERIKDAVEVLETAADLVQGVRLRSKIQNILDLDADELAAYDVPRGVLGLSDHPWLQDAVQGKVQAHTPLKKYTLVLSKKNAKHIAAFFDETGLTAAINNALPYLEGREQVEELGKLQATVKALHDTPRGLVFLFEDDLKALSCAADTFGRAARALARPAENEDPADEAKSLAKAALAEGMKTLGKPSYKKEIMGDIIKTLATEYGVALPNNRAI